MKQNRPIIAIRTGLLGVFAAALTLGPSATQANAQILCGPHDQVAESLNGKFKESRAGLGLAGDGNVVELFVSQKGSWTMVVTRPNGTSCLVAAGDNWEIVEPLHEKPGKARL